MGETNLKTLYLAWIEDFCNVLFDKEDLPSGVSLALEQLVDSDPLSYSVTSEKISDLTTTYGGADGDVPLYIRRWLMPYARPHLVSDKNKRLYKSGRAT